jgi:hypothetical protein
MLITLRQAFTWKMEGSINLTLLYDYVLIHFIQVVDLWVVGL